MKKYSHLFFDLDHTLWDTEKNSEETLLELIDDFELEKKGIENKNYFIEVYHHHNNSLWDAYSKKLVPREEVRYMRFLRTLNHFNISETSLIDQLSDEFMKRGPYKKNLIPYAIEILQYLQLRNYRLFVITNGFQEVQHIKLNNSGLSGYFQKIFISEEVGYLKPQKEIFEFAMQESGCMKEQALMIGDNFDADITGATNAGIDSIFYNPSGQVLPDQPSGIRSLQELREFL